MRLVFPGSAEKYNCFPICAFIPGLPGKTNEDTKESLDLLYALKDSKWVLVPTLIVPLEGTRPGTSKGAKILNLTDRWQWIFFFTAGDAIWTSGGESNPPGENLTPEFRSINT